MAHLQTHFTSSYVNNDIQERRHPRKGNQTSSKVVTSGSRVLSQADTIVSLSQHLWVSRWFFNVSKYSWENNYGRHIWDRLSNAWQYCKIFFSPSRWHGWRNRKVYQGRRRNSCKHSVCCYSWIFCSRYHTLVYVFSLVWSPKWCYYWFGLAVKYLPYIGLPFQKHVRIGREQLSLMVQRPFQHVLHTRVSLQYVNDSRTNEYRTIGKRDCRALVHILYTWWWNWIGGIIRTRRYCGLGSINYVWRWNHPLHELRTKEVDTDRWSLIKQLRAILRNQHSSILFWRWHKTPPFRKRLKQRLTVWYVDYISFPSFFLSNAGLMWNARWALFVYQAFPIDHIYLMSMHWSKNSSDGG